MKIRLGFAATFVVAALLCEAAHATILINDSFSTYNNGNLIGAPNAGDGWIQTGAKATLPLQVTGGKVVLPTVQTGDNQDAFKTFGSVTTPPAIGSKSVFVGAVMKVNSAPAIGGAITSPSYFLALDNAADGSGFDNERVAAIDNSSHVPNTYLLEARVTGQAGSPFVAGTTPLLYGTTYNVVIEANLTALGTDESIKLYVNPTNNNQGAQSPYLVSPISAGTPLTGIGGLIISQFQSASTGNSGAEILGLRAATTFAEAANVAVPEPSSIVLAGAASMLFLFARRRRRQ